MYCFFLDKNRTFLLVFTASAVHSRTSLILINALTSADCLVLHCG